MSNKDFFCTSFCNQAHRLIDGKPLDHECYVLPITALREEMDGKVGQAQETLAKWKNRQVHKGIRSKARQANRTGNGCSAGSKAMNDLVEQPSVTERNTVTPVTCNTVTSGQPSATQMS